MGKVNGKKIKYQSLWRREYRRRKEAEWTAEIAKEVAKSMERPFTEERYREAINLLIKLLGDETVEQLKKRGEKA